MIDIHYHILLGADDVAKSIYKSIEMVFTARKIGFDGIIVF